MLCINNIYEGFSCPVTVGLIKGRHAMPVKEYIFDSTESIFDYDSMNTTIMSFLEENVGIRKTYGTGINQADYTDCEVFLGQKDLVVYVTGLTAVTAQLISCCARNGVSLTLMHYDMQSGEYIPQVIF